MKIGDPQHSMCCKYISDTAELQRSYALVGLGRRGKEKVLARFFVVRRSSEMHIWSIRDFGEGEI